MQNGTGGREGGLATALAVHLLREYGNGTVAPTISAAAFR
jgi:hypothetical protein